MKEGKQYTESQKSLPQEKGIMTLLKADIDQRDLSVWPGRLDALLQIIDSLEKQLKDSPLTKVEITSGHIDRTETMSNLLQCLREFGTRQFNFFFDGFGPNGNLEKSRQYPPPYVLRRTLDQMGHDITVIQRAIEQRRAENGTSQMCETLMKADCLAYKALLPAIKQGLLNNTTAITYFQKEATVRIIPYAPVVLIGIPYTSLKTEQDLLAIPHEVGHYVYRHGTREGSRLAGTLREEIKWEDAWIDNWLEEIFADVYGCLVAGPVMGLNFLQLQLDKTLDEFLEDDGHHPVPALRPEIYIRVLRELNLDTEADALKEHWQQWLELRGNPKKFLPQGADGKEITLKDARKRLKTIIRHIKDLLALDQPVWSSNLDKSFILASETDFEEEEGAKLADELYRVFKLYVDSVASGCVPKVPELQKAEGQVSLPPGDDPEIIKSVSWTPGCTNSWLDAFIKMANELKTSQADCAHSGNKHSLIPPEAWSLVFIMLGWTIGGAEIAAHPK